MSATDATPPDGLGEAEREALADLCDVEAVEGPGKPGYCFRHHAPAEWAGRANASEVCCAVVEAAVTPVVARLVADAEQRGREGAAARCESASEVRPFGSDAELRCLLVAPHPFYRHYAAAPADPGRFWTWSDKHPEFPCPSVDCPGDARYAPPGRGHCGGCMGGTPAAARIARGQS